MVELHSNFTFEGSKDVVDGVFPTDLNLSPDWEFNGRR